MKALSLTQPWAALLAVGAKTIETRDWPTEFRGWFAIHASASLPPFASDFCYERRVVTCLEEAMNYARQNREPVPWLEDWFKITPEHLPRGKIIGVAYLSHCEPTTHVFDVDGSGSFTTRHDSKVHVLNMQVSRMLNFRDVPQYEKYFGDYRPRGDKGRRRFAFWTTHAVTLLEPIAVKGTLGFWDTRTQYMKEHQIADGEIGSTGYDGYDDAIYRELLHRGVQLPLPGMAKALATRGHAVVVNNDETIVATL